MPFITPEDVGTTPRGSLSAKRRLQAWERTEGTCVICENRIDGVRDRWIVEHIRALELGGADTLDNMGPAHEVCGRTKTRDDHARTAKAKRQKIRHLGTKVTARTLPGCRRDALKRKINGMVVPRADDGPIRLPRSFTSPALADTATQPLVATVKNEPVTPSARNRVSTNRNGSGQNDEITAMATQAPSISTAASLHLRDRKEDQPAYPGHLAVLFQDRPLASDEGPVEYDALRTCILHQMNPTDVVEAIWTRDIVSLTWEAMCLRQWRTGILTQARLAAVQQLIRPVLEIQGQRGLNPEDNHQSGCLALGWVSGAEGERAYVEKLLQERGLGAAYVSAKAFQLTLTEMERADRMIAALDQRRDTLFHQIACKRAIPICQGEQPLRS